MITGFDMFKPPAAQDGPGGWIVIIREHTGDHPSIWYEKDYPNAVTAEAALIARVGRHVR